MQIRLISIGNKMPDWVDKGFNEYQKRLNQDVRLELIDLPAVKRSKNADEETIKQKEAQLILNQLKKNEHKNDHIVALDIQGKMHTTEQLSKRMEQWLNGGQHISLLVGGPDGLDPSCLQIAKEKWSLSLLTFPHPLVRVILAEQLYRAWSLLKGHPYHK